MGDRRTPDYVSPHYRGSTKITIFTENGCDTVANVMKNGFMKFKSNPVTHF